LGCRREPLAGRRRGRDELGVGGGRVGGAHHQRSDQRGGEGGGQHSGQDGGAGGTSQGACPAGDARGPGGLPYGRHVPSLAGARPRAGVTPRLRRLAVVVAATAAWLVAAAAPAAAHGDDGPTNEAARL